MQDKKKEKKRYAVRINLRSSGDCRPDSKGGKVLGRGSDKRRKRIPRFAVQGKKL